MTPAVLIPLINGVIDIVKENTVDKDRKAELVAKLEQSQLQLIELFIKTQTTPKVDAFVKLVYVTVHTILPLLRPLGAAAMTAFGIYVHMKGIEMDPITLAIFDGAFPGWGVSRHVNKQTILNKEPTKPIGEKKDPFEGLPDYIKNG